MISAKVRRKRLSGEAIFYAKYRTFAQTGSGRISEKLKKSRFLADAFLPFPVRTQQQ
jgi:hypothetical protein